MSQARLRLLYVEDDALNRDLLRATLQRATDPRIAAAVVDVAVNMADARHSLTGERYDLILLDRRLPDGDGFRLASEVRADVHPAQPIIVALTADAVPATRLSALEAGCDAILIKPYAPAALLALLGEQLDQRGTSTAAPGRV